MAAYQAYAALLQAAASPLVRADVSTGELFPHHETGLPTLTFKVSLSFEESDLAGSPPEAAVFLRTLQEWACEWQQPAVVEVLMCLPDEYPEKPVEVRLLRPLLVAGTGGVQNGFFLRLPELFPSGWVVATPLTDVLAWVRACLLGRGSLSSAPAEVRTDTDAFYTLDAYAATRCRALFPCVDTSAYVHRSHFQHRYTIVSSHFAQYAMYVDIPPGFDAGGKALLPMHALELLMRCELQEGLEAGPGSTAYMGANLAAATGAGTPRGDALSSLLVGQEDAMTSEAAMLFSATSALGFPVFLGCREFTSPEPDIIIVPIEVLANLGVGEGSVVTLARVDLPQITSVVLQPHGAEFEFVEEVTGLPPREFLEQSFSKFSCLTPGETIVVDGDILGGKEYRFTVVAVEPSSAVWPAGALFQGFASQISIEFLPAADTVVAPEEGEAGPKVGMFRGYEGGGGVDFSSLMGGGGGAGGGSSAHPVPASVAVAAAAAATAAAPTASAAAAAAAAASAPLTIAVPGLVGGGGGRSSSSSSSSSGSGSGSSGGGQGGSSSGGISVRSHTFDPAAAAHIAPPPVSPGSTARVGAPPVGGVSIEERRRRAAEAAAKRMGLNA